MKDIAIGTLCLIVGILLFRQFPGDTKEQKSSDLLRSTTEQTASPEKEEFVLSDELKKRLEESGLSTNPDEWSGISIKEKE